MIIAAVDSGDGNSTAGMGNGTVRKNNMSIEVVDSPRRKTRLCRPARNDHRIGREKRKRDVGNSKRRRATTVFFLRKGDEIVNRLRSSNDPAVKKSKVTFYFVA